MFVLIILTCTLDLADSHEQILLKCLFFAQHIFLPDHFFLNFETGFFFIYFFIVSKILHSYTIHL